MAYALENALFQWRDGDRRLAQTSEPARADLDGAAYVVIEELPTWCGGVLYNGTDDVLTLRAKVPASEYAIEHVLQLEMTPEQARALVDALGQCLSRAEAAAKVLDVTEEPSD